MAVFVSRNESSDRLIGAKLVITSARTLWRVRKTYRQLKSFKDSEGSEEPKRWAFCHRLYN